MRRSTSSSRFSSPESGMPQPLSRFGPNTNIAFGPAALATVPELAILPMLVISYWSGIETHESRLLMHCLKADFETVAAMYSSLSGAEAKRSVLLSAARLRLSKEHYQLFEAIRIAAKSSRNRRNDFAHHQWGVPDVKDMLGLRDPRFSLEDNVEIAKYNAYFEEWISRSIKERKEIVFPDLPDTLLTNGVLMFSKAELEDEVNNASRANRTYSMFVTGVPMLPSRQEKALEQLLLDPQLQQVLARLSRKSATQEPQG